MRWDDLPPFLALMRHGSLSAAARVLGVEHATIARRIDQLEADLHLRLFDRLPRGWRPTADAEALMPRAETAEAAMQAIRRQAGGGSEGTVRLTAPPLLVAELLAPRLGPFLAAHPGIRLVIEAEAARANLTAGEADLALRIGPPEGQSLRVRKLADVAYRPYGRDPQAGVIRPDPARTTTERWMQDWSGARPVVLNTADTATMRAAVAAGLGVALLPAFLAGDLPPVGADHLIRPLYLALHEDKARAPRVRLVADALAQILQSLRHDLA